LVRTAPGSYLAVLNHQTMASVAKDTKGHSHQRERASGSHLGQLIVLEYSCISPAASAFRLPDARVLARKLGSASSIVVTRVSPLANQHHRAGHGADEEQPDKPEEVGAELEVAREKAAEREQHAQASAHPRPRCLVHP
jgi:hypothetical protein